MGWDTLDRTNESGQSRSLGLPFVGVGCLPLLLSLPTSHCQLLAGLCTSLGFPQLRNHPPYVTIPHSAVECTCTGADCLGSFSLTYQKSCKYPVKTDTEREQQILLLFIFKNAFQSSGKKDHPSSQILYIIFNLRISTGQIYNCTRYNNYKEQCSCRCSHTNANTFYFTCFN